MICIKGDVSRFAFLKERSIYLKSKTIIVSTQKHPLVLFAVLSVLGALVVAVLTTVPFISAASRLHFFTALGLTPLMLGAMGHFVPVLTRTSPRSQDIRPACLALVAGVITIAGLTVWFPAVYLAAVIGLLGASDLLVNIHRRIRTALGSPHPSIYWYVAALCSFITALCAILLASLFPIHWQSLRTLHLHLNLTGFVALTALGTLQVLLPTAGGFSDPDAAWRLKRDLPWALAGTLAIAVGAAFWPPLGYAGAALWLYPLARFVGAMYAYRKDILKWRGAAFSLLSATLGLTVVLGLALSHATAPASGYQLLLVMLSLFFLPLISGALTQLLPVWLVASFQENDRTPLRETLEIGGGIRNLAFWLGGSLVLAENLWGMVIVAGAALLFMLQIGAAVYQTRGQ